MSLKTWRFFRSLCAITAPGSTSTVTAQTASSPNMGCPSLSLTDARFQIPMRALAVDQREGKAHARGRRPKARGDRGKPGKSFLSAVLLKGQSGHDPNGNEEVLSL